jgi:glutamate synthase (NADPH/NADH) large chain
MAFIYDPDMAFPSKVNPETLTWQRIETPHWEGVVKALVQQHVAETQSVYAEQLLNDWQREIQHFWHVVPKEMIKRLPQPLTVEVPMAAAGDD